MSTTQTTNLGLTKATPGTGEPFSTSVVNTNLDTIDSAVGELQDSVYTTDPTGIFTIDANNFTLRYFYFYKYGKIACMQIGWKSKVSISVTSGTHLGKIATSYVPKINCFAGSDVSTGFVGPTGDFWIRGTSNISVGGEEMSNCIYILP